MESDELETEDLVPSPLTREIEAGLNAGRLYFDNQGQALLSVGAVLGALRRWGRVLGPKEIPKRDTLSERDTTAIVDLESELEALESRQQELPSPSLDPWSPGLPVARDVQDDGPTDDIPDGEQEGT